jgi:predicted transposase YdaD
MVLTTVDKAQAPAEAKYLLNRTRQEVPQPTTQAIIEMITTIIAYKFEQLSRVEVESMLGLALKKTRLYQDIKEEGLEEGREEGLAEGRQAIASMLSRLLTKRFGELPQQIHASIAGLSLPVLQDLSEALLDFTSLAELESWLQTRSHNPNIAQLDD